MKVSVQEQVASELEKFCVNLDEEIERIEPLISFRGGYAIVYKGILRANQTKVAIKTGKWPGGGTTIKEVLHEAFIWSKLCHDNIAPICGFTTVFDDSVSLVSPWQEMGNAHDYVQNHEVDPRPLLLGIARGLNYLHSRALGPIIYGDLKGYNILITDDGRALLTDFGTSFLAVSSGTTTLWPCRGGTLKWMAPEVLDNQNLSVESDVWAFGMTALELFTRQEPFHDISSIPRIVVRIVNGLPSRPSVESTCDRLTDTWWKICMRCWQQDPALRPSASDITFEIEGRLMYFR
ncbi:kinase-like domain-containing protein [Scleroderma yunnanense]